MAPEPYLPYLSPRLLRLRLQLLRSKCQVDLIRASSGRLMSCLSIVVRASCYVHALSPSQVRPGTARHSSVRVAHSVNVQRCWRPQAIVMLSARPGYTTAAFAVRDAGRRVIRQRSSFELHYLLIWLDTLQRLGHKSNLASPPQDAGRNV